MAMVRTIFGLFVNVIDAKAAIVALREQRYSPREIPLILKQPQSESQQPTASSPTIEETNVIAGITIGAAIGGVIGLLIGLGAITIPMAGISVVASALNVTRALASTTLGIIVGGIGGGLIVIGMSYIDHPSIRFHIRRDTALGATSFVVIPARSTERESVEDILRKYNVSAIHSFKITTDISLTSEYILNGNGKPRVSEQQYPRQRRRSTFANPIEVQKYLKHIDYPMTKEGLVHEAEIEGADEAVINTLEQLPEQEFTSPIVVSKAIGTIKR